MQHNVQGSPEKTFFYQSEFLELKSRESKQTNNGWIYKDELKIANNENDKLEGKCSSDQSCVLLTSCRDECEKLKTNLLQTNTEVNIENHTNYIKEI